MGAVADAVARQRHMAHEIMARRAAPRTRVHAGDFAGTPEAYGRDDWEPYECFHLCLGCGYLSESGKEHCPGCGAFTWVDLRRNLDADAIRRMERRGRQIVPRELGRWAHLTAILLGLTTAALIAWSMWDEFKDGSGAVGLMMLLLGLFVTGSTAWFLPRLLAFVVFRRRPVFPMRWRLPLPLPPPKLRPTLTSDGQVAPTEELISAPISGRPCVAYEVTVIFDTPGDLRPPMWVLEEERSVGFELGGHAVSRDRVTLDLPPAPVGEGDDEATDKKIARFLRQRGLFFAEGTFRLFEAIVEPGMTCRLEHFQGAVPRICEG
jgi:hypothetical protein